MSYNEVQLKAHSSLCSNYGAWLRCATTPQPIECQPPDVTHKLHVHLKTHIILVKLAVPKMPKEVCIERYGGRLKQSKPLL